MKEQLIVMGEYCPWPRKPNRKELTRRRRERIAAGLPAPVPTPAKVRPNALTPTHGEVPDAAEGWVPDRPLVDPELRIERIVTVRFDDCSVRKFYLMRVRPAVLKAKRELAKKKLQESRRDLREAKKREAKQVKRRVRLMLALLGR